MGRLHTSGRARFVRRAAAIAAIVMGAALYALSAITSAGAQTLQPARPPSGISVVQVEGLIDPPNASLIEHSLRDAQRDNVMLLVFQLNSSGAIDTNVERLAHMMGSATVPVAVWVGPSGGNAKGGAALVALSAPVVSVAQG